LSAPSRYEVLVRIATGGMASVFVGRLKTQVGVSRLVALKRPHPFILADRKLRRSVIEEARTASAIHHANVVSVVDVELIDDAPILVLEYVEGATLSELVRRAADLPEVDFAPIAMRIILETARGLHAAHELGILHRDVTPQNVLVGIDGVSRLSDFGIAKSAAQRAEPTATGSLKGKLGYLAPEYVFDRSFVVASDLFSFAVVAWEALTKRRLFGGGSEVDTLAKIIALVRPPLDEVAPHLVPFEPALARALGREPTERHGSVAELASELEEIAEGSIGIASPAEVAAFVARACGEQLAARRAVLAAAEPRPAEEMEDLPLRAPNARDEIETASVSDPAAAAPAIALPTPVAINAMPTSRSRGPLVAAISAGVVVVGAIGFLAMRSRATPPPPTAQAPPAVAIAPSASASAGPPPEETAVAPSSTAAPVPRANTRGRPATRPPAPGATGAKTPSTGSAPRAYPSHAPPNPYAP
jgi:eukaryotic-like serine/threonine-protein kinase